MIRTIFSLLLATVCLSAGSVFADADVASPEKLDSTGFRDVLVRSGNVYISGQPEEASFSKLKEKGVTTIVNLRTPREMNDRNIVPFDEQAVVEELGLNYVHISLGGDAHPYTPVALEQFAAAVESAEGDVLLHCTVAWRASHMWASYLVQYKGLSPDEAIAHAREINFGQLPMEKLLNKNMTLK